MRNTYKPNTNIYFCFLLLFESTEVIGRILLVYNSYMEDMNIVFKLVMWLFGQVSYRWIKPTIFSEILGFKLHLVHIKI